MLKENNNFYLNMFYLSILSERGKFFNFSMPVFFFYHSLLNYYKRYRYFERWKLQNSRNIQKYQKNEIFMQSQFSTKNFSVCCYNSKVNNYRNINFLPNIYNKLYRHNLIINLTILGFDFFYTLLVLNKNFNLSTSSIY